MNTPTCLTLVHWSVILKSGTLLPFWTHWLRWTGNVVKLLMSSLWTFNHFNRFSSLIWSSQHFRLSVPPPLLDCLVYCLSDVRWTDDDRWPWRRPRFDSNWNDRINLVGTVSQRRIERKGALTYRWQPYHSVIPMCLESQCQFYSRFILRE